jgi:phosphoglycolate phosphatase
MGVFGEVDVSQGIRGILFDKDGTLLDFAATWLPAYERIAHALTHGDAATADRMMAAGGFDRAAGGFQPTSALVAGTNLEIAEIWAPFVGVADVRSLADWLDAEFQRHAQAGMVPVTDLGALFGRLRGRGLVLGVATNDSEAAALGQLASLRIGRLIAFVAGYDSGHGGKPGPGMVHAFCRAAALAPTDVAVVGDSVHDLEMGRTAGAGMLVGVLTGASPRDLLATLADHVIDSVCELEPLLDRLAASHAAPPRQSGRDRDHGVVVD